MSSSRDPGGFRHVGDTEIYRGYIWTAVVGDFETPDGEPFQREKIERGVERACWKRPVSTERIRELAADVEAEVQADFETEVPSRHIGRLVMDRLGAVDQVAYVRFASVYREFKDVADFVAELQPILKTPHRENEPDVQ